MLEERKVTFSWRDYRDNQEKYMKLEALEFIRRYLMHILPDNFVKIRHYGLLSNRNRKTKLQKCKLILSVENNNEEASNWQESLFNLKGIDTTKCPKCKEGRMIKIGTIPKGITYPVLIINAA